MTNKSTITGVGQRDTGADEKVPNGQNWSNLRKKRNEIVPEFSQVVLVVKNLHAIEGDLRDMSSIPELGRSLGIGNGNPLQYSCLESPKDRRACPLSIGGLQFIGLQRVGHDQSD